MPHTPTGMDEIRAAIDALDRQIVPLLAARTDWVRSAAQFKAGRADVVVPWRIEDVIARISALAVEIGADPRPLATMYRAIIDASIGEEAKTWDVLHAQASDPGATDR